MANRADSMDAATDPNLISIRIVKSPSQCTNYEDDRRSRHSSIGGLRSYEDARRSRHSSIGGRSIDQKFSPVDGGYGWMIVLGCWLMHAIIGGWNRGYGVVYVELRHRFQSSAAVTAWVGGACTAVRMGFSPVATTLSNHFSARTVVFCGAIMLGASIILNGFAPNVYFLFLSHSILSGFGGSLVYSPCIVMVSQYFDKRRNIALGVATSGSGLGLFLFPPLMELFFAYYGYMGAMLLGGAVMFNCCVAGMLMRPLIQCQPTDIRVAYKKTKPKRHKSDLKKYLDLRLWREPPFVVFVVSSAFATSCYITAQYLLVDMAINIGVPSVHASYLLSAVGVMDMVTRLLSGLIFKHFQQRQQALYNFALFMNGASAMLFIAPPSFALFMALAIIQGIACGMITAQRAAMVACLVGVDRVSSSFGLTVSTQGIGMLVGPTFAGYLRDVTGSYMWSFVFIGCCGLVSSALYLSLRCFEPPKPPPKPTIFQQRRRVPSMVSWCQ